MNKREIKFSDCTNLTKGKPPAALPYYGDDAVPYLNPEFLRGNANTETAKPATNSVWVEDGDIILLWDGSNAGEILRGRKGLLASTMTIIIHDDEFERDYFYYALKLWEAFLKGQASGSGIPHVDKEILGKICILQLEKTEQTHIAAILSTIDRAIEQTEALIAKQQRIKAGLMQDLLTRGIDENGTIRSEATHAFKDSPLGRIPVEWDIKCLDSCVRSDSPICYGILMPGTEFDNGVPVIKVKDIFDGCICEDSILLTDPKIEHQYKRSRLNEGDLLLTIRGTTGRVAIVPKTLDGANITQDTARIRLKQEHSNIFFYFLLQSRTIQDQVILHTLGQAVKGINICEVRRLTLALPERTEQEQISKMLSRVDSLWKDALEYLSKFRQLKTALMHDLLTGKVRVTELLNQT